MAPPHGRRSRGSRGGGRLPAPHHTRSAQLYFPDFLTSSDDDGHPLDVGPGIDRVLSTGKGRLRTEIGRLASGMPRPPTWLDDFAAGRPRALHRLGDALRRYHAVALAPHADRAAADVRRDRNDRARRVLRNGGEAVLGAPGPSARWRPPVLEVDHPTTQHLRLDGRSLTLVPSFFPHDHPLALADPSLPPARPSTACSGPPGRRAAFPGHRTHHHRPRGPPARLPLSRQPPRDDPAPGGTRRHRTAGRRRSALPHGAGHRARARHT
ncbi:hypothetical protein [Streptomyces sp. RKND-216]|uniref:hypothetical protein n=1 Tax=Streptomyces sp. RKND-216 TaxID=2562581 RepID=UPI001FF7BEC7|nr:hypothetical protein [Streptomyces sp. RKND-216]